VNREILNLSIGKQSRLIIIRDILDALLDFIEVSPRERNQLITALSELLRNIMAYAREGQLVLSARQVSSRWRIFFTLSDKGPGIGHLDEILKGVYRFPVGKGLGIASARRLLHHFEIRTTLNVGTEISGFLNVTHLNEKKLEGPDLAKFRTKAMAAFLNQEAYQYLQRMNDLTALQNIKLKDEIASNETKLSYLSHDLKTPINAILGYTFLLQDTLTGQERDEALERITVNSRDLLQMIEGLLHDFQHADQKIDIDIESLVRTQIKSQLVPLLFGKEVEVKSELQPGVKISLSDPSPINHILSNLFSNSAKFTEKGTIQVTTQKAPDNTRDGIKMIVSDSGVGIDAEKLPHIFELFNHEHGYEGSGVGLAIVQDIVKQIGGTINVTSRRGVGTEFAIWLPVG
jgi:signal transduction histidine kinase